MSHTAVPEKTGWPLTRAVNELIRYDHVPRMQMALERSNRGEGDQPAHPQRTHRPDVGPVGHFTGQQLVMPAMAGQEDGLDPLKLSQSQLIGWRPERC